MSQSYGQHNGHYDWLMASRGLTNKNDKLLAKGQRNSLIKDINNDEAILVTKPIKV